MCQVRNEFDVVHQPAYKVSLDAKGCVKNCEVGEYESEVTDTASILTVPTSYTAKVCLKCSDPANTPEQNKCHSCDQNAVCTRCVYPFKLDMQTKGCVAECPT